MFMRSNPSHIWGFIYRFSDTRIHYITVVVNIFGYSQWDGLFLVMSLVLVLQPLPPNHDMRTTASVFHLRHPIKTGFCCSIPLTGAMTIIRSISIFLNSVQLQISLYSEWMWYRSPSRTLFTPLLVPANERFHQSTSPFTWKNSSAYNRR